MAEAGLVQLRWIVESERRGHRFRAWERLFDEVVRPAVSELARLPIESLYASKRRTEENEPVAWLAVFAPAATEAAIKPAVERHVGQRHCEFDTTNDPEREELLGSKCARFRRGLYLFTRVALDLHEPAVREANKRVLIGIGAVDRSGRAGLEPLLEKQSRTYRAFDATEREEFWRLFGHNCLKAQLTDCGHALYNIVLGVDWFEMHDPAVVAAFIGSEWL